MARPRRQASVRIADDAFGDSQFERYLVHELVHLIIDPMSEEHDFQLDTLESERKVEYSARMERVMERAVEDLSFILYNSQF